MFPVLWRTLFSETGISVLVRACGGLSRLVSPPVIGAGSGSSRTAVLRPWCQHKHSERVNNSLISLGKWVWPWRSPGVYGPRFEDQCSTSPHELPEEGRRDCYPMALISFNGRWGQEKTPCAPNPSPHMLFSTARTLSRFSTESLFRDTPSPSLQRRLDSTGEPSWKDPVLLPPGLKLTCAASRLVIT